MRADQKAKQHYVIVLKNNNISIYEYNVKSKELNIIKYKGEDVFEFDDSFWDWFCRKIEYESEIPICFFVFTDKKTFNIPDNVKLGFPEIKKRVIYSLLKQKTKVKSLNCIIFPDNNPIVQQDHKRNEFQIKSQKSLYNKTELNTQKKIKTKEPIKTYFKLKTKYYQSN